MDPREVRDGAAAEEPLCDPGVVVGELRRRAGDLPWVVAGGAVLDFLFGWRSRDVDVFSPCIGEVLARLPPELRVWVEGVYVACGEHLVERVLWNFDVNVCQFGLVSHDPLHVYATQEALLGLVFGKVRLNPRLPEGGVTRRQVLRLVKYARKLGFALDVEQLRAASQRPPSSAVLPDFGYVGPVIKVPLSLFSLDPELPRELAAH